jgi:hypothetical protein
MRGETVACAPLDDSGSPLPFRVEDVLVSSSAQSVVPEELDRGQQCPRFLGRLARWVDWRGTVAAPHGIRRHVPQNRLSRTEV